MLNADAAIQESSFIVEKQQAQQGSEQKQLSVEKNKRQKSAAFAKVPKQLAHAFYVWMD
ncbi:MAG: hypothetical protein ACRCYY_13725 [Trueperaceae bacterium]